jgi:hypothetical protein
MHALRRGFGTTAATTLAALAMLLVGAQGAHANGVGGSEDTYTTTNSTHHTAVSAIIRQLHVYDFGPVYDPTPPNGCQVTISWGDGTTSAATLGAPDANNEEEVTATHTYAAAGSLQTTQSATPAACEPGTPTQTTTLITAGDFVLGTNYNTNYDATIFDVTVHTACVVPKLKGKKLKADKKKLRKARCRLGKVKGHKSKQAKVKKQRPKPGTLLPPRSKVNVKVG